MTNLGITAEIVDESFQKWQRHAELAAVFPRGGIFWLLADDPQRIQNGAIASHNRFVDAGYIRNTNSKLSAVDIHDRSCQRVGGGI